MPHQIQNNMVQAQQQQAGGLLGHIMQHLPQIAGLFNPAAGAGLSAAQSILGAGQAGGQIGTQMGQAIQDGESKIGGANPNSQVTPESVQESAAPQQQQSGGGQGGGSEQGGGGGAPQPPAPEQTDPLQESKAGPPIAKAPLNPQQHQTLAQIQQQFPQLFSMIKNNPGMGAGLQNFVNSVEQYQGGAPQEGMA